MRIHWESGREGQGRWWRHWTNRASAGAKRWSRAESREGEEGSIIAIKSQTSRPRKCKREVTQKREETALKRASYTSSSSDPRPTRRLRHAWPSAPPRLGRRLKLVRSLDTVDPLARQLVFLIQRRSTSFAKTHRKDRSYRN
jgi:hypothetical protein